MLLLLVLVEVLADLTVGVGYDTPPVSQERSTGARFIPYPKSVSGNPLGTSQGTSQSTSLHDGMMGFEV